VGPRPSISFCIGTRGPADRARALLELVRPHVDEVVLAVDRKGGMDVLDACADLADRRLTYELEHSPSWLVGWMLHQCSCDWILRLDDDEVPSAALLEGLPELVADRYPIAMRIPRRWLYPAPDRYLTSFPWALEYQARLVRNVPSLWRFEGRVHSSGEWLGDVRMVEPSIYHLVALTLTEEERQAKRDWYDSIVPGLAVEDFRLGDMYVPEELDGLETAPVPDEDRPGIAALLDPAATVRASRSGPPVEDATLDEIRLHNSWRDVMPDAYRASIAFVAPRQRLKPGPARHFEVEVQNLGGEVWRRPHFRPAEFALAWRWLDGGSGRPLWGEGRIPFPETVRPGMRTRMHMTLDPPPLPGAYLLELDVVHEHVRWFGATATLAVTVEPPAADPAPRPNGQRLVDQASSAQGGRRPRLSGRLARPLDALRPRRRPPGGG
jgi:hypothetical protein